MTLAAFLTLITGALTTAALSFSGIAMGVPLGLVLALVRWLRVPLLSAVVAVYVSLVRATPIVTFALFIFFVLPSFGIELAPVPAAILTLTLNTAAFNCEIWRGALEIFPRDQIEAARAHGMTTPLLFRRIILPQLWRSSIGPLTSEMTILLKGTPAVAVIGVVEITRAASRIGAETYRPLPPFLTAAVIYTLLIVVIVAGQRLVERRIARLYGYAV
ncbi:amino acid ABC transporter permease [Jiella sp. MQZ9-1]|uniref:Amino acid ABC transporter permease n=1 Tax=Jiella flava TaxID=2816857 RepID=A0A939JWQ0_9HYPH|nr:amino acid ABC transporter permease [Jiella flava]MBO0662541.1 amino acid ABC transporter permease [Jiella flava]MCD2472912.1 amino acid ABC transporter permease [Jiella flava]